MEENKEIESKPEKEERKTSKVMDFVLDNPELLVALGFKAYDLLKWFLNTKNNSSVSDYSEVGKLAEIVTNIPKRKFTEAFERSGGYVHLHEGWHQSEANKLFAEMNGIVNKPGYSVRRSTIVGAKA